MKTLLRYPKTAAVVVAAMSFVCGSCLLIGADFGLRPWWSLPCLLWLGTMGLPSTLAVLLVAACWGTHPMLTGFLPFVIGSVALAVTFQWIGFTALAKISRRFTPV